jgi:hypothetical protein
LLPALVEEVEADHGDLNEEQEHHEGVVKAKEACDTAASAVSTQDADRSRDKHKRPRPTKNVDKPWVPTLPGVQFSLAESQWKGREACVMGQQRRMR